MVFARELYSWDVEGTLARPLGRAPALGVPEPSLTVGLVPQRINLLTPKAFYNLALGNTLGLRGVSNPTLKALNIDSIKDRPGTNYQTRSGYECLKTSDPRVLPWAKL
jgi:hypothetical protein